MLVLTSSALAAFFVVYAFTTRYEVMLALVALHGIVWSGLLSASAAQVADLLPESRRAEGLGYWGFSTIAAVATAPTVGFWVHKIGWTVLCLEGALLNGAMALSAWWLTRGLRPPVAQPHRRLIQIEWRVVAISVTLFLYSYGYGGVTSFVALYADACHTTPRSLYFITFSLATIAVRLVTGRLAERIGHRRIFLPSLPLIVLGYALLAVSGTWPWLVLSGIVFGAGFGAAWPVFTAYLLQHFDPARRGAVFGGVLACFDAGIGTGSIASGWIISHWGFRAAYLTGAALAACSIPYFLAVEKRALPVSTLDRPPDISI
jgi:MFS family permease